MKSIIFLIIVSYTLSGLSAAAPKGAKVKPAKGSVIEVTQKAGTVTLLNQKKVPVVVTDLSQARIDIVSPGIQRLLKAIAGDRRFVIYNGNDEFSFLITRKSFNARSEFSTHQQYTGQNYHIQMTKEAKDYRSTISEKIITCTYSDTCLTSRIVTDSDGNTTTEMVWESCTSYGKQNARVDDQTWLERENYVIHNEGNQIRFRTLFAPKENQEVLERLTSCR